MNRLFGCSTALALILCGGLASGCTSSQNVASTQQAAKSLAPVQSAAESEEADSAAKVAASPTNGADDAQKLALVEEDTGESASLLAQALESPLEVSPEKRTRLRRGGGSYKIGKPYKIKGRLYVPKDEPGYSVQGRASWYGPGFDGRRTANGEIFDQNQLTAAHTTLPLPSYARVTNLKNGHSVVVRVNDRGPYAHNRVADLSKKAAIMLGFHHAGHTDIKMEYLGRAPLKGSDNDQLLASFSGDAASPAELPTTQLAVVEQIKKGVETVQDGIETVQKEAAKLLPASETQTAERKEDGASRTGKMGRLRFGREASEAPLGYSAVSPVQAKAFKFILSDRSVAQQ